MWIQAVIVLLVATALCAEAEVLVPLPLPVGAPCTTSGGLGGPVIPCQSGLTCVLTTFGNPALDAPTGGTCVALDEKPPACTVTFCGSFGGDAVCAVSNQVATCRAWATRGDLGGIPPNCHMVCTKECRVPRLVASNGAEYCTTCVLHVASCEADFAFYGPVPAPKDKCKGTIDIFDAAECCTKRGIGCLKRGDSCTTIGSMFPTVDCAKGLKCVLTDFGFPAADGPTRGTCRKVGRLRKCTVRFCSRKGRRGICRIGRECATCFAWATRTDFGTKPNCNFACLAFCLDYKRRPLGSDGRRYCSRCALRAKSCQTQFEVYGPIRKKH